MPKTSLPQTLEVSQTTRTEKTDKEKKHKEKKTKAMGRGPLCKLAKNGFLDGHFKEYQALVNPPAYICKKCGRAAVDKKSLCKPERIEQ